MVGNGGGEGGGGWWGGRGVKPSYDAVWQGRGPEEAKIVWRNKWTAHCYSQDLSVHHPYLLYFHFYNLKIIFFGLGYS